MRNGGEQFVQGTEQGVVTALKHQEFTKYCSEKLEQEAFGFVCIIRAAAALK